MKRITLLLDDDVADELMSHLEDLTAADSFFNGAMDSVMVNGEVWEQGEVHDDDVAEAVDVAFEGIANVLHPLYNTGNIEVAEA